MRKGDEKFHAQYGPGVNPRDTVVSQMDGVSAVFGAYILGKEERGFILEVREQERREGGAMGMKGVDERSGGMQREKTREKRRERQREQEEEARTKCQIERGREAHTQLLTGRGEDGGVGQERLCWGLGCVPSWVGMGI